MVRTAVVSGIPGVGASKVCEDARRLVGNDYTLVNLGDLMLGLALEHGLATDREALAHLRLRDQQILQRRASEHVARMAQEGPLIVNTHLVVETAYGYVPGMDDVVLSELDPSVIVVVDAPDEAIRERREQSERSYDRFAQHVGFHRQLQNAAALGYSLRSHAPIQYVQNENADEASEKIAAIVEALV